MARFVINHIIHKRRPAWQTWPYYRFSPLPQQQMNKMEKKARGGNGIHVIVFPFPVQGHINPMLQFSKQLASSGLRVTLATTSSFATKAQIQPLLRPYQMVPLTLHLRKLLTPTWRDSMILHPIVSLSWLKRNSYWKTVLDASCMIQPCHGAMT